jgi:hypothetical protein
MRDFRGWSAQGRQESYAKTRQAITDGLIPPARRCKRCGQTEGLVQYHNEDYSDPIKYLEPLCYRCHMMLHSEHLNPEAVTQYWREVFTEGKRYPPVYRPSYHKIMYEHGVF